MTNRVRLTEAAATRFPDLANRTGTMVLAQPAYGTTTTATCWLLVVWDGRDGDKTWLPPDHIWLPPGDVETVEDEGGLPPLDPSDPNAPAP